MADHAATCPPDASKKMTEEFMAIMQGNSDLKADKDAGMDSKFAEADTDGDSLLNWQEY